jgi:hypothetical protein
MHKNYYGAFFDIKPQGNFQIDREKKYFVEGIATTGLKG